MKKASNIIEREHEKSILLDVSYRGDGKKKPIVIFCHGYKGFKDWGYWNAMAEKYAEANLFFLKFNFSYNGGTINEPIDFSDLKAFGENNFTRELDDLETVISWITSPLNTYSKEINTNEIILIGHSRGGGIVSIKASEDRRVSKVITLAGVSDYKSRFPVGEELAHWEKEGVAFIENSRTKQQMPHYFQFYTNFIENEQRLTISKAIKNLSKPYLIVHGTADETVPLKEAKDLHSWNTKSELFTIQNANHVFGSSHPCDKETLPVDLQIAITKTIGFIKE
jgi:esterase/lipase